MNKQELKKLETKVLRYMYEYYILGSPTILDSDYDKLMNILTIEGSNVSKIVDFPTIKEIEKLGLDPSEIVDFVKKDEKKYKHLSPYLSLEKIVVEDENNLPLKSVELFLNRISTNDDKYEASLKYDGNGIELIYENGKLNKALTRGDKIKGLDKTNKIKLIVPNNISMVNGTYQIRGEIVIEKQLWEKKYNNIEEGKISNPRNFVAGVLNREEYSLNEIKDLVFVAYDMCMIDKSNNNDVIPVKDTMKTLKDLSFNDKYNPPIYYFNNLDVFKDIYFKMKDEREKCPFLVDGIVIKYPERLRKKLGTTSHHPKHSIAIKFPPTEVSTEIVDIIWTQGKDRCFTPVAILKPVELDGTLVKRASLHNLGYIINNGCFPGAKVTIAKKGEIIPQVVNILSKSPYIGEYMKEFNNFKKNIYEKI